MLDFNRDAFPLNVRVKKMNSILSKVVDNYIGVISNKVTMKKKNISLIERVYQHLKDSGEVKERIQLIKMHPWMSTVEEK